MMSRWCSFEEVCHIIKRLVLSVEKGPNNITKRLSRVGADTNVAKRRLDI